MNRGEPHLSRLGQILLRAADPAYELQRLLQQVTVSTALGNADAHAKNYSLVHGNGTITLSPLYDVSPTMAFPAGQRRASMPVAGKFRIDEITRGHLLAEARTWGVPETVARATIAKAMDDLGFGMQSTERQYPNLPPAIRSCFRVHFERLAKSSW